MSISKFLLIAVGAGVCGCGVATSMRPPGERHPPGRRPADAPEIRLAAITVFDDVDDLEAIQATVDQLQALRYNAVAVHARYRGDATYVPNRANRTYPNEEPRSPAAGGVDVLGEFATRGHAAGLKVFAYINAFLVTSGARPERRNQHVANAHPEWRTYAYNDGDPVIQSADEEGEGLWIDPALPAAQVYVAAIAGDIMMNYDCDGIILDRIRYPQTSWRRTERDFGYHPQAVARFNEQRGAVGLPNPADPQWIAFRQDAVSETVRRIYERITAIDPGHILLAYPIGRMRDAAEFSYQDWAAWLDQGIVDGVLAQTYTRDMSTYRKRLDEYRSAYRGERHFGVTLDGFRPGVDLVAQIRLARDTGFSGTSLFRHGTMGALGYFEQLQQAWTDTAPWPAMPWKHRP